MPPTIAEERRKQSLCHLICQIFIAELLGTAILTCVGCSQNGAFSLWTFPLATTAAIYIFDPFSGAHINPGSTIVALIMGQLPQRRFVVIYWTAQLLGGLLGYLIHYNITLIGVDSTTGCITVPFQSTAQTFGLEMIASFIFFMATAARFDPRRNASKEADSLKIGFIMFGLHYSLYQIMALSMNSARSLPPALFNKIFQGHWIYWVAPNIAALLAGGFYRFAFLNKLGRHYDEDKQS